MIGKTRPLGRGRVATAVLLAVVAAVAVGGAAPQAAADSPETAVLDWNKHALDALANAQVPPPGAPPGFLVGAQMPAYVQGIHLAMVQGAVYDAVISIVGGYEPYLDVPTAPSGASESAAVATAARDTLIGILNQAVTAGALPGGVRDTIVTRLEGLHAAALVLADDGDVDQGVTAGEAAADAMIEARSTNGVPDDGRWGSFRFPCGDEPGQWRPAGVVSCTPPPTGGSDAFAWAAKVKPFVVESNEQFLSKGPNALTSGQYTKEYNEVKALGVAGLVRTGEQLAVFNFFQANPVEMFSRSFRTYALAQGLSLVEQARLFGLFGLAGGDTSITCWEDKAHWRFWRPQTAIRLADTDGNPKTEKVDGWTSAIATPPYPDHSSGYNCNTGVYMTIAELYFGQGRTTFTVSNLNGTAREYRHFRDVWEDTIDARVYQGIHFRSPRRSGRENRPRRRPLGREARSRTCEVIQRTGSAVVRRRTPCYVSAGSRATPERCAFRRRIAFVCSCETRDSVTPRTSPISRRVSSS